MRAVVDAARFREALTQVLRIFSGNMPEQVIVKCTGEACTLTATNLAQWAQAELPALGDSFAFCPGNLRQLAAACKYFTGELAVQYAPAEGAPDGEHPEGRVQFQSGGKFCEQWSTATDLFPELPTFEPMQICQASLASIRSRYERIKYAVCTRADHPELGGVQFRDDRMIALDGYRLAWARDPALRAERPFTVPDWAMRQLSGIPAGQCRILVGERYASFETGGSRLVTRLLPGSFLDVDQAVPARFREECRCDVSQAMESIRYLGDCTGGKKFVVRLDRGILSRDKGGDGVSAILPLDPPSDMVIGLDARFLLDALGQFHAQKTASVTMRMDTGLSPVVLTDGSGDLALLLPCRLRESGTSAA